MVSPELAQVFEAYYAVPRESNAASPGRFQLGLVHWNSLHWSSSLISPASLSLSCLVPLHHRLLPHACRCDASAFQRRRHHVFAFTFQDFIAELGRFLPWQRSSSRGSFSFVRHCPLCPSTRAAHNNTLHHFAFSFSSAFVLPRTTSPAGRCST